MSKTLILDYIHEQPLVINNVIDKINSLDVKSVFPEDFKSAIYIIGSGSSLNAAHAARSQWQRVCSSLSILDPIDFILQLRTGLVKQNSIVIGISQSGRSRATVDALKEAGEQGHKTLAITGDAKSPMAGVVGEAFEVPIGEEVVGAKTKGYSATVAFLIGLATILQGEKFTLDTGLISAYLEQESLAKELCQRLVQTDLCFVIGSRNNFGTAREGALKIIEIAKLPAMHFDVEDSLHGPFTTLDANSFVILLGLDPLAQDWIGGALKILKSRGVNGVFVSKGKVSTIEEIDLGSLGETLACEPVSDVVFLQLLAYYFAKSKGVDPIELGHGRSYLRSVTKILD